MRTTALTIALLYLPSSYEWSRGSAFFVLAAIVWAVVCDAKDWRK